MKKLLALLLLFGVVGCQLSDEEIKNRIDKLHEEMEEEARKMANGDCFGSSDC